MKISYNWLKEFIPGIPEPKKLGNILTSVGLEVEDITRMEEIKGSLSGLVVGEVITCEKHPGADQLKITNVDVQNGELLQIVCGAPNVAVGQKVVVAPVGATIYPVKGEPVIIRKARIRGVDSVGMICAEDEIGIGSGHSGIMLLPPYIKAGSSVAAYFEPGSDWIYDIGLTPNRIDAMSHLGVAKDLCAYLSHHAQKEVTVLSPFNDQFHSDTNGLPIEVVIENTLACERYTGVGITDIQVKPSPEWMRKKLESIGVRPINNIVDVTNYILHETGQPLHAFDIKAIKRNKIIVKNLPAETSFITLDEKERKLDQEDLMICDGNSAPMCFGGVFGGLYSGVKTTTTEIFLEAAWFNPVAIRKTSMRHALRTDAAVRFEKGVDISQTVLVLKRAAIMIKELAGGKIASGITDVYPSPKEKAVIFLTDDYLKKISGRLYQRKPVKSILESLYFEIEEENVAGLRVRVPFSKPDVRLPADIVEEIMRIDGYDNVEIPSRITLSPAADAGNAASAVKEKVAGYLTGAGFSEIFTNSLTNSSYYEQLALTSAVKIINSLSADLDIMRPSLREPGLECIAHNLNRKNSDLLFFEFGNSYSITGPGSYIQTAHLCLYITGSKNKNSWKEKPAKRDFYFIKGVCKNIFTVCGLTDIGFAISKNDQFDYSLDVVTGGHTVARTGMVHKKILDKFSIKQPVLFADLNWEKILQLSEKVTIEYADIPKFPSVYRDLSVVVAKDVSYAQIEKLIDDLKIAHLKNVSLFDVFESEKIGISKKAFAISFTFTDSEKTLIDKEIESMMNKIIVSFESKLRAEIRK